MLFPVEAAKQIGGEEIETEPRWDTGKQLD
jgi:hypothetical protein